MNKLFLILISLCTFTNLYGQIGINATNTPPNASAMLDVSSITKGVLIPKMTTAQKFSIVNPAEGLMVYDLDVKQFSYCLTPNTLGGTLINCNWVNFGNTAPAQSNWNTNGNDIYNANLEKVGIGTNTPSQKLEINSGTPNVSGLRLTQASGAASTGQSTSTFVTVPYATGVTFDNIGNLYVTNFTGNKIHKVTPTGIVTDFVSAGLSGPHDIIFGPDGNLYVSQYYGNIVSKVSLSGVLSTFASGFSNPLGLTFDTAGNLYVTNTGNGQLSKLTSTGTIVSLSFGVGLSSPYNCVFNPTTNKIYISNYAANEVAQIDASTGGSKTTFASGVPVCTGITIDANGNLYVSEAGPGKIVKITPAANVSDFAYTTYPFDLTSDTQGNLFVANQTVNTISKVSPKYNTFLTLNPLGDVVPSNAGLGWVESGNDVKNTNLGTVITNSASSQNTNAIFGSNGTGISLQKNSPTIGFNTFRDNTNVQRYIGSGYGFNLFADITAGSLYWNKMGNGTTNGLVGANEQTVMALTQTGKLGIGTTNPSEKLEVQGNISLSGNIIIESPIALPLAVNWSATFINFPSTIPSYYKDKENQIHLRGYAFYTANNTYQTTLIGTLPLGYRPSGNEYFGNTIIQSNGEIYGRAEASLGVSLSGIIFRSDL